MEKAEIVITWSGNNFGAYVPELNGCVATGATAKEVKENILEAIDLHIQGSLADGDPLPKKFLHHISFIYKFDTRALLNYYKGVFTAPALERITGINQKQLHHYADGLKKPRPQQRKKIEDGLHQLAGELLAVQL